MAHQRNEDPEQPAQLSRRRVMHGAAGVGVAGATTGFLIGTGSSAAAEPAAVPAAEHEATVGEPVVARVRDARTGEIDLFVGDGHARVHDRQLAARLAQAATSAR